MAQLRIGHHILGEIIDILESRSEIDPNMLEYLRNLHNTGYSVLIPGKIAYELYLLVDSTPSAALASEYLEYRLTDAGIFQEEDPDADEYRPTTYMSTGGSKFPPHRGGRGYTIRASVLRTRAIRATRRDR
jgi:hypothetical protein